MCYSVLSVWRLVLERLYGPVGDSLADAHDGLLCCEELQWALSGGSSLVVRDFRGWSLQYLPFRENKRNALLLFFKVASRKSDEGR